MTTCSWERAAEARRLIGHLSPSGPPLPLRFAFPQLGQTGDLSRPIPFVGQRVAQG
jgi:hypothetical protein